ncbi:MAG: tRNA-dihydrouridine synthase family protein [Polyangiaceae bacterium]
MLLSPSPSSRFAFAPKTMLAPMEGVCRPSTRALIGSYAPIGVFCTPFVRITEQPPSEDFLRRVVERETVRPLSVQLLGTHAAHLAMAARILWEAGASVIDLNFGCPSRQVMRKGAGSALLENPLEVQRIVSAVRAVVPGTLSAKIRGGFTMLDADLTVARAVEAAGVDFLVVHPRSGLQGYDGIADWRWTRKVKRALRIPVIGNGDLWYARDAVRLLRWSGCDGLMLGRACLRNPWIFGQIDALLSGERPRVPTGGDVLSHLRGIAKGLLSELDPLGPRPLGSLKEHAQYVLRVLPEGRRLALRRQALESRTIEELLERLVPLESCGPLDLAEDGPLRLEPSAVVYCDDE